MKIIKVETGGRRWRLLERFEQNEGFTVRIINRTPRNVHSILRRLELDLWARRREGLDSKKVEEN